MPNFLNTPLVPKSATQPVEDYLTEPHLDQSPLMAGVKGFGAGALEGLRGLTSPSQLAGLALMAVPGAGAARGAASVAEEAPAALQGLSRAIPEAAEAIPSMGQGAWAGSKINPTNWGAELQGARDFVGRMGGIPNEMSAGRMYTTPPSSLGLPSALGGEAGRISTEGVVGAGALGAAGAYAYPKVKQALAALQGAGQQANPFSQISGTLDAASQKGQKR